MNFHLTDDEQMQLDQITSAMQQSSADVRHALEELDKFFEQLEEDSDPAERLPEQAEDLCNNGEPHSSDPCIVCGRELLS